MRTRFTATLVEKDGKVVGIILPRSVSPVRSNRMAKPGEVRVPCEVITEDDPEYMRLSLGLPEDDPDAPGYQPPDPDKAKTAPWRENEGTDDPHDRA